VLTSYLILYFPEYVDVNFTAKVEEQLDEVSGGAQSGYCCCCCCEIIALLLLLLCLTTSFW
jgi:hypothetical protein